MPPSDWSDKEAWVRCHAARLEGKRASENDRYKFPLKNRFRPFPEDNRGRIWLPGCGLSEAPLEYAESGCDVLATDFSPAAVAYQKELREIFLREREEVEVKGSFEVSEHDFLLSPPATDFAAVYNCRAFQGLSETSMIAAAKTFYAALRPGGGCVMETMNVQGATRIAIEDSLIAAGYYLPYHMSDRWYQNQLASTGIHYAMIMGKPRIPYNNQYPRERFETYRERDEKVLDSFWEEYERRRREEAAEVETTIRNPATKWVQFIMRTG